MDKVDRNWKEVEVPDDAPDSEILEFVKLLCTFSVDVNTKDPKVKDWIYKHKEWIKKGGE